MQGKEWGAFLLLSTIWGASYLFIKVAGQDLMPFTLVATRLGLAMMAIWSVLLLRGARPPRDLRTLGLLALVGLTNTAIPFVLITWGERTVDSGVASVLVSTTPLFSLVIAHLVLHDERITWFKAGGLLAGFLGMVLIFSRSLSGFLFPAQGAMSWPVIRGQIAIVAAALCYAGSAVLVRRWLRHVEPIFTAVIPLSAAFIWTFAGALALESPISLRMGSAALFSILALGLVGTALAYPLYFFVMRAWGATRATLVTYLSPVVSVVLGALVLGEPADARLLAGFVLIAGGVVLANRRPTAQALVAEAPPEAASGEVCAGRRGSDRKTIVCQTAHKVVDTDAASTLY